MSLEWMRAAVAGGGLSQYFFSDIWALSLLLLRMGTKWMHIYHFRFSPTRPPVHWSGIRTAFAHGPVCPQSLPPEAVEPEATALKKVRLNWNWRNHIPVFFFAWNGMSVSVSASSTLNRKPLVILHQISRARLKFLRRTAKALPVERQSEDCLHLNIFVPIKQGRRQGKLWLLSLKRSLIWVLFFLHHEYV